MAKETSGHKRLILHFPKSESRKKKKKTNLTLMDTGVYWMWILFHFRNISDRKREQMRDFHRVTKSPSVSNCNSALGEDIKVALKLQANLRLRWSLMNSSKNCSKQVCYIFQYDMWYSCWLVIRFKDKMFFFFPKDLY